MNSYKKADNLVRKLLVIFYIAWLVFSPVVTNPVYAIDVTNDLNEEITDTEEVDIEEDEVSDLTVEGDLEPPDVEGEVKEIIVEDVEEITEVPVTVLDTYEDNRVVPDDIKALFYKFDIPKQPITRSVSSANNYSLQAQGITLMATPKPTVSVTSPAWSTGHYSHNLPVQVAGIAYSENSTVDYVDVHIARPNATEGEFLMKLSNSTQDNPYNWNHEWTPTIEGTYHFMYKAYDLNGVVSSQAYLISQTYVYSAMELSIDTPTDQITTSSALQFTGTVTSPIYVVTDVDLTFTNLADQSNVEYPAVLNPDYTWSYDLTTGTLPDGTYDVTVTATNTELLEVSEQITMTIDTTDPTLTINTVYNSIYNEGDVIPSLSVTSTDANPLGEVCFTTSLVLQGGSTTISNDCYTAYQALIDGNGTQSANQFNWNLPPALLFNGLSVFDTSILDEGMYETVITTKDAVNNTSLEETISFELINTAPEVTINQSQVISEGSSATFDASFNDPSYIEEGTPLSLSSEVYDLMKADDAEWTYVIDFGDGTYSEQKVVHKPGNLNIDDHIYTHEGVYSAVLALCESPYNAIGDGIQILSTGEGQCVTSTSEVVVSNYAPTSVITNSILGTIYVGDSVTLTAHVTAGNAPYTYLWTGDCNGGTDPTYDFPTGNTGNYSCDVIITDSDGDTASDDIKIQVKAVKNNDKTKKTILSTVQEPTIVVNDTPVVAVSIPEQGVVLGVADEQVVPVSEPTTTETGHSLSAPEVLLATTPSILGYILIANKSGMIEKIGQILMILKNMKPW